jgi:hypothetical protein
MIGIMSEKSKTVKMDAQNNEKLSYEQLEQLANNLNRQCQQFYSQLQEANKIISEFNEVGMLLSILEKSEHFNEDFVTRCSNKVEEIITKALDSAEEQDEKTKE